MCNRATVYPCNPVTGILECPLIVRNTGNVRATNITVQGDSNNCSKPLMLPGEVFDCWMWRDVPESEFTANTFSLTASGLTGTAVGGQLSALSSTASVTNPTKHVALLSVTVSPSTVPIQKAGQSNQLNITVVSGLGEKVL